MPIPDFDNVLLGRYIRAIENPDSIGYRDGKWYQSTRKGDDPNNRGFGVDIKYNNKAQKLVKDRPGKWLTVEEERDLRNEHIDYAVGILDKWTPKILATPPSEEKKAIATGMLYRGDGIKSILRNPTLKNAYYSGSDEDFKDAVSSYYKEKNTRHYHPERAKLHDAFIDSNKQEEKQDVFNYNWEDNSSLNIGHFKNGGTLKENNSAWEKLSQKNKAEIIRIAVDKGIYNLDNIRNMYNEYAEGGPYKPGTIYGRPTEEGLNIVSPEFDVLMLGKVATNVAKEAAGNIINSGINVNTKQRVKDAVTNYSNTITKHGNELKKDIDDIKWFWNEGLYKDAIKGVEPVLIDGYNWLETLSKAPKTIVGDALGPTKKRIFDYMYQNTWPTVPGLFKNKKEK